MVVNLDRYLPFKISRMSIFYFRISDPSIFFLIRPCDFSKCYLRVFRTRFVFDYWMWAFIFLHVLADLLVPGSVCSWSRNVYYNVGAWLLKLSFACWLDLNMWTVQDFSGSQFKCPWRCHFMAWKPESNTRWTVTLANYLWRNAQSLSLIHIWRCRRRG